MKTNRFLLMIVCMMAISFMFAQYTTLNFEPSGSGASWNWVVGENAANPALQFPNNPSSSGINTSATVAHFQAQAAGNPWALCFSDDMEDFQFNASNTIVKIMVYKPRISPVAIKFEGGSTPIEIQVSNTLINQWEELTFDFSGQIGNTYSRIVIIPDFLARSQNYDIYFDNIRIPATNIAPPSVPTIAAPTPTQNESNVISLFSDQYTNVTVNTWSAGWDMADVSDVQIAGNATKLYNNLIFAGIEFTSPTVNANTMTHFHMDIWTPNSTDLPNVFRIKLVDFGANGVWSGGDDVEHELTFNASSVPALVSQNWLSFDIPLASFTNLVTRGHLAQLIISGNLSTVYVDNVYFYTTAGQSSIATLSDLSVNGVTISGFNPGIISYDYEVPFGNPVPLISAVATDPEASFDITQAIAVPGQASVVVTAEDDVSTLTYTVNFEWGDAFPTEAPPAPFIDSEDVISIYSDYYVNVPGTDFNPNWGQQTSVTVDYLVDGINTLYYQNLNYQGTQYANQDVSAYEALHLDFWTVNSTALSVYLISPGAETPYNLTIEPGEWGSVDIPIRYFVPPVNPANVFQFKVVGNGDVWLANLYFWKEATIIGSNATLGDLKVDGSTINGFSPLTENYVYGLLEGTTTVPQISSVTLSDPNASYIITQAVAVPGVATVVVTAQDGITTKTYSVAYSIMYPNSLPPTPTEISSNVISLFSDSYPNVAVDTWLTPWSQATHEMVTILGNPVKKYSNVNFIGIETVGANLIDVSEMTHVHIDIWTPDTNTFRFKLVDWGSNGSWGGGDDTEHELAYANPLTGQWISYDIPLSSFTGLNITGNMAQYILSKDPLGTIYVDNFYFYNMGSAVPSNVMIVSTPSGITISWDPVAGASSYTVYASSAPNGVFTPVIGGTYAGSSWSGPASDSRKFFYITATE